MIVYDLATSKNTVNVEWEHGKSYVVLDRALLYTIKRDFPKHSTFWHQLTSRILNMLSLSARS